MNNRRYYSKDQDIRFRMTTPEEERELFLKARAGDEEAKEFLIRNHLLFAKTQAESMVGGGLSQDEVVSAANFAVMKAFQSFDPMRGIRFTTFLRPFIRGQVSRLWRSKFSGGLIDPSASCRDHGGSFTQGSTDDVRGKMVGKVFDPALNVPDESPTVEELDLTKFNRDCVTKVLATLSKRDAELVRLRYVEGWTFTRIGIKRGVSREAIRAKHAQIVKVLRRRLTAEGVER